MEPNNQTTAPVEHKKVGPIVVTLVVVLILVIVALYIFASKISQPNPADTAETETVATTTVSQQQVPTVTNTADDPQSLKNDLDTSVSGLDTQNF